MANFITRNKIKVPSRSILYAITTMMEKRNQPRNFFWREEVCRGVQGKCVCSSRENVVTETINKQCIACIAKQYILSLHFGNTLNNNNGP